MVVLLICGQYQLREPDRIITIMKSFSSESSKFIRRLGPWSPSWIFSNTVSISLRYSKTKFRKNNKNLHQNFWLRLQGGFTRLNGVLLTTKSTVSFSTQSLTLQSTALRVRLSSILPTLLSDSAVFYVRWSLTPGVLFTAEYDFRGPLPTAEFDSVMSCPPSTPSITHSNISMKLKLHTGT